MFQRRKRRRQPIIIDDDDEPQPWIEIPRDLDVDEWLYGDGREEDDYSEDSFP